MKTWWIGLALVCALNAMARGQGLTSDDWQAIQAIPEWKPETQDYSENFAVDLRPKLPPPGEQKMNDCTSWAIAYAAKTYDEVVDQEWKPDVAKRIFSPRFIYNQINNGRDSGSNALNALNLLKEKGCATLATCGYVANDFRGQPSAAAFKEAENFKISSFYLVRSKEAIRRALLQGKIVVIGTSTTPVFMSARWQVYDKTLHERGVAQRRPGQPHGKHALCIVGFDDQKGAFLVMNSWGTRWGNGGFFWLGYDLADRFNGAQDGPEFLDYALIIQDERAKVVESGGTYVAQKPDKDSIRPVASAEYRGYDAKAKAHRYWYTAALSGSKQTLDYVAKVDWTYEESGKAGKPVSATDRAGGFSTTGTSAKPVFLLRGNVTFKDNSSKQVTVNFTLPPPNADNRDIRLKFDEEYYGKLVPGGQREPQPWWHWKFTFEGRLTDLRDIAKVTWNVGKMDRIEPVRAQTLESIARGGGEFAASGIAMEANDISAEVTFNDGATKRLTFNPRFESPVDDSLRIETSFREAPGGGDQPMYDFTLRLNGPRARTLLQIDKVVYHFGPLFGNAVREASWGTSKFDVSGSSHRDFLIRVKVHLTHGKVEELEKWIELGPSARYADPFHLEIVPSDQYYGLVGGKPHWLVTLVPSGDPRSLTRADKIVYRYTDESGKESQRTVTRADSPDLRLAVYAPGRIEGTARVYFSDGNSTILKLNVKPASPRIDALELGLTTALRTTPGLGPRGFWQASPKGPGRLLQGVQSADYQYVREGVLRRILVEPTHKEWAYLLGASDYIDESTTVSAVVAMADLSRQEIAAPAEFKLVKRSQSPDALHLLLIERFWGIEKGKPMWGIEALVAGGSAELAKVRKATFWRASDNEPNVVTDFKDGIARTLGVYRPDEIVVQLELDGAAEPLRLSRRTTPLGGRTARPLELRTARLVYEAKQPGATQWRVWLAGWEQELRRVKQVEYRLPKSLSESSIVIDNRYHKGEPGFALTMQSKEPVMVDAVATLDDGKTIELTVQANPPVPPLGWEYAAKYYEQLEGKDWYAVNFRMVGATEELRKAREIDYVTQSLFPVFRGDRRRYSYPNAEHQCQTTTAFDMDSVIVGYPGAAAKTLKGGPIKLDAPVERELKVKFARGLTWPGQTPEQTEWIAHLAGPEKEMEQIAEVTWSDGSARPQRIDRRHGERFDGFECRFYGKDAPSASATLRMIDGPERKVGK